MGEDPPLRAHMGKVSSGRPPAVDATARTASASMRGGMRFPKPSSAEFAGSRRPILSGLALGEVPSPAPRPERLRGRRLVWSSCLSRKLEGRTASSLVTRHERRQLSWTQTDRCTRLEH